MRGAEAALLGEQRIAAEAEQVEVERLVGLPLVVALPFDGDRLRGLAVRGQGLVMPARMPCIATPCRQPRNPSALPFGATPSRLGVCIIVAQPGNPFSLRRPGERRAAAQTERRGGAGPVRGLLGAKDLTGRFFCYQRYQSEPSTSRPEGVTAAHQVVPLIVGASVRTLPSVRPTNMPPL